jgi:hypothetical protein
MGRSEESCRFIFQYFVQRSFLSSRPTCLGKLELDGYCTVYDLAFEYNGIQHSSFHPYFHRTYKEFERQLERDYRKNELCKRYGIILMTIPHIYTYKTIYPMSIEIYSQLRNAEEIRKKQYMVYRCPHIFKSSTPFF